MGYIDGLDRYRDTFYCETPTNLITRHTEIYASNCSQFAINPSRFKAMESEMVIYTENLVDKEPNER